MAFHANEFRLRRAEEGEALAEGERESLAEMNKKCERARNFI